MKIHISLQDDKGNYYEGDAELHKKKLKNHSSLSVKQKNDLPTPSNLLEQLYKKNYFKNEKKQADVMKKLKDDGYNFGDPQVAMALSRAKYLQKTGSRGQYNFIQKFPPG